jgi:hypothetical protein
MEVKMPSAKDLIRGFEQQIAQNSAANLKAEYTSVIRPAYVRRYGGSNVPKELWVDEENATFDGGGMPGMVQVNGGVANHPVPGVRTFAVAHETGHAVVIQQFQRSGVPFFSPYGGDGTNMKLHEQMADVIAMSVLKDYAPQAAAEVIRSLNALAQALGPGTPMTHPPGWVRAALIRSFYYRQDFDAVFRSLAQSHNP